eukprot:4119402-Amphidinium_carterae.1
MVASAVHHDISGLVMCEDTMGMVEPMATRRRPASASAGGSLPVSGGAKLPCAKASSKPSAQTLSAPLPDRRTGGTLAPWKAHGHCNFAPCKYCQNQPTCKAFSAFNPSKAMATAVDGTTH